MIPTRRFTKEGTLTHAKLVLEAGFIVIEDDPRWSKAVIDRLEDLTWEDGSDMPGLQMHYRYPPEAKVDGVRWFECSGGDEADARGRRVLRLYNLRNAPPARIRTRTKCT